MPGVHVRTLSQFDWLDQESLLTIPGSYWLCHKKNIYKFIFRYHRTMKNTVQFSYGRELLKIIRRIIKCHPTQGQQFGTRHLLVTYNCTSWTRQDKMFAILKFQQRTNAAAFSHAFVLTIKICSSSDQPLFNLKYPIVREAEAGTTFKDLNIPLDDEEKTNKTMICAIDKMSPRKTTVCQSKKIDQATKHDTMDNTLNKTETSINYIMQNNMIDDKYKNLDTCNESTITSATDKYITKKFNANSHDTYNSKSIDCNTKILKIETQHHIDNTPSKTDIKDINKVENDICINQQTKSVNEKDQKDLKVLSSSKSPFSGVIKDYDDMDELPLSNRFSASDQSIDIRLMNNKNNLKTNLKTNNETTVDSSVPYQYFIEKEIENAKHIMKQSTCFSNTEAIQENLQRQETSEMKNINKDSVPKIIQQDNNESIQKEYCNKITAVKSQQEDTRHVTFWKANDNQEKNNIYTKSCKFERRKQKSRESDKKADDKILRSSNITDLVMEGLMFTIRKDDDSVAVIEQKTKLEVDEVLENSEKAETKEGEKCLVNSSLLRLENLITMIDSPRGKGQQHKSDHTLNNSVYSPPFNIFANDPAYNLSDNNIDRKTDKPSICNYDRQNINQLNSYRSRWQHIYSNSSTINSNNYSTDGNAIKRKEQLMEWEHTDYEQNVKKDMQRTDIEMKKKEGKEENDGKKEKKDIVPESFQSTIFSSEKKNTEPQDNLLMDCMYIEEPTKHDTHIRMKKCPDLLPSQSSSSNNTSLENIFTISEKPEKRNSNVPKILSNKAITVEQMPLALQKVLRHTCKKRKLSSLMKNNNPQTEVETKDTIPEDKIISEADVSLQKKCTDSSIACDPLSIETADSMETESKKDIISNKNSSEIEGNTYPKSMKTDNETHRNLRKNTSLKHGSSRKLQDITEDFYNDLIYNKDNTIQQRCLRQRRKSLNNPNDIKNDKMRIEMLKFIQDITEGAKVVVKRLNIDNKSGLLEKNSTLATCMH